MFVTRPESASPPGGAVRAPRLVHIGHREFGSSGEYVASALTNDYLTDVGKASGYAFAEPLLEAGHRNSYALMGAAVLADLTVASGAPDLIVLAHSTPDADLSRAAGCYLADRMPGNPLTFAVSDHGAGVGFAAVRIVTAYARSGQFRRAAVLILDQSTLPFEVPDGAAVRPARDVCVGLSFDLTGAGNAVVRQTPGVSPARAAELMPALDRGVAVVGAGLGPWASGPGVRRHPAPRDLAATSVWVTIESVLGTTGGPILVADYDASARTLSTLTITGDRTC